MTIAGSPTALQVMWNPPAEPNGVILSYTIVCYESTTDSDSGSGSGMQMSGLLPIELLNKTLIFTVVSGNQSQATVTGLMPYTYYECYVTANTSVGAGNASIIQLSRTDESGWLSKRKYMQK